MNIPSDYVARLLMEERTDRLRDEAAADRLARSVRGRRKARRRRRAAGPVIPLQRRSDQLPRAPAEDTAGGTAEAEGQEAS